MTEAHEVLAAARVDDEDVSVAGSSEHELPTRVEPVQTQKQQQVMTSCRTHTIPTE